MPFTVTCFGVVDNVVACDDSLPEIVYYSHITVSFGVSCFSVVNNVVAGDGSPIYLVYNLDIAVSFGIAGGAVVAYIFALHIALRRGYG